MIFVKALTLMLPFLIGCSASATPIDLAPTATTATPTPKEDSKLEWADLSSTAAQWKSHYRVDDPFTKITNDRGDGNEGLYGTRNFRVVLHGVYYRGGANNTYNKYLKRSNMNPLQDHGLKNLCEEGFGKSIYFYPNNFSAAKKRTICGDAKSSNQLDYQQLTAFDKSNHEVILNQIYQRIKGQINGPIYGHCWNGWHASGLVASMALQQFCDWSHAEAGDYWKRNTDGNSEGHEAVLRQVMNFNKISRLEISDSEKAAICPRK